MDDHAAGDHRALQMISYWSLSTSSFAVAVLLIALPPTTTACADDYSECAAIPAESRAKVPSKLSETGLYADIVHDMTSSDVVPYTPRLPLWSDGASKRRWISIPIGTKIDTTNMDDWVFPEGTKIWKEFRRNDTRVETRLFQNVGANSWVGVAYVWNDDESDAIASWEGQSNARGTPHDVPASDQCVGCHGGRKSNVLGFSAIQLADDKVAVDRTTQAGWFTTTPPSALALPSGAGGGAAGGALGYFQGNCAHCHNQARPDTKRTTPRCYNPRNDMDLWLRVDKLGSVEVTPAYQSTVTNEDRRAQIRKRMSSRNDGEQMPPLATEDVDVSGKAAVEAWLDEF